MSNLGAVVAILVAVCSSASQAACDTAATCTDETSLIQLQHSVRQGAPSRPHRVGKGSIHDICYVTSYCDIGAQFPKKASEMTAEQKAGAKTCFSACRNPSHEHIIDKSGKIERAAGGKDYVEQVAQTKKKDDSVAAFLQQFARQPDYSQSYGNQSWGSGYGSYGNDGANRSYSNGSYGGYPSVVNNNNNNNNNNGYGYGNMSRDRPPREASEGSWRSNDTPTEDNQASTHQASTQAEPLPQTTTIVKTHKEKVYDISLAKEGMPCVCSIGQMGFKKLDRVKLFYPDNDKSETAAAYCDKSVRVRGHVNDVIIAVHKCCSRKCESDADQPDMKKCKQDCEDFFGIMVSDETEKMKKNARKAGLKAPVVDQHVGAPEVDATSD